MEQARGPSELSASGFKDLIDEAGERVLAEIRERLAHLRQNPDGLELATLILRDLPFLLAEVDALRARSEESERDLRTLRDERHSQDLAFRALQSVVDQQRAEIEAVRAHLDEAQRQRMELAQALSAIIAATAGAPRQRDTLRAYAQALNRIRDLLAEQAAECGPAPDDEGHSTAPLGDGA
jgi:septal ring factor EnvC (AmiA/AmiB activator)